MAQWNKPLLVVSASHIEALVLIPDTSFLPPFSASVPGKAVEDGPRTWSCATSIGRPRWCSWPLPLTCSRHAYCGHLGIEPVRKGLCLSLTSFHCCAFQINQCIILKIYKMSWHLAHSTFIPLCLVLLTKFYFCWNSSHSSKVSPLGWQLLSPQMGNDSFFPCFLSSLLMCCLS